MHRIFDQPKSKNPKVAYFCMEYAVDQCLKIYSGGLGYLAGSHMRSAYELKQNVLGIGILWSYGYYDQTRSENQHMNIQYIKKNYSFLTNTGIMFPINIHGTSVMVQVWYLDPEVFKTAPLFLLTTDIPENDFLSRTITQKLYDSNAATRIAQSIILGAGGQKLLETLNQEPDKYHLNEGHGLPLLFQLYQKYKSLAKLKEKVVFTTHTPEEAGNEVQSLDLLAEMGFLGDLNKEEVINIMGAEKDVLNYTLTALRLSGKANAVSKLHKLTSQEMWGAYKYICPIISITNAQNQKYWQDAELKDIFIKKNKTALVKRKKELKKSLFKIVADQTGKIFDENILTIVWARRFAGYKRADLIIHDYTRFLNLVTRQECPIQVIWAGKPHPADAHGIAIFNQLIDKTADLTRCAVLTGYELELSEALKKGADVWLNTPRFPREASGTSGMSACMNATVNLSIADGWFP
ncbi:MAG: alpha-glucan family phosphorylase, partial [Cytophagaceae bacterium]